MRLRRSNDEAIQRMSRLLELDDVPSTVHSAPPAAGRQDHGWTVTRPVEPRPELDKLHGWVPEPAQVTTGGRRSVAGTLRRQPAAPSQPAEPAMDELDRFLASQGLDGLSDVDDWNVDPEPARAGWWTRMSVPWRAAVALLVLGAIAVVVIGFRWMSTGRPGTTTPIPARAISTAVPAAAGSGAASATGVQPSRPSSGAPAAGGGAASGTPSGTVYVHVVGRVVRPGVVKLPAGSRVADAVKAAGGFEPGADQQAVNLARVVQDGEQLRVPRPGETVAPAVAGPTGAAGLGTPQKAGSIGSRVNLNSADANALDALDGVGPVLAKRIVDYRTAHGSFRTVEQLNDVPGIGEKLMARLRPQVAV